MQGAAFLSRQALSATLADAREISKKVTQAYMAYKMQPRCQ